MFRPVEWWEAEFGAFVTDRQRLSAYELQRQGWSVVGVASAGFVQGRIDFVLLCLEQGQNQGLIDPEGVLHNPPACLSPVGVG